MPLSTTSKRELCDQLTRLAHLKQGRNDANIFALREEQLRSAVDLLSPLSDTLGLFRSRGIEVGELPSETAHRLHEDLSTICLRFSDDLRFVADETIFRDLLHNDLPAFAQSLKTALVATWNGYTNANMKHWDIDILQVLEQFQVFKATVASVRRLDGQIRISVDTLPQTEEDIQAFHRGLLELEQVWQSLTDDPTGVFPPSVAAFLIAIRARGGANLDLLTDELRHRLSDQDIEDFFHVVIKKIY